MKQIKRHSQLITRSHNTEVRGVDNKREVQFHAEHLGVKYGRSFAHMHEESPDKTQTHLFRLRRCRFISGDNKNTAQLSPRFGPKVVIGSQNPAIPRRRTP